MRIGPLLVFAFCFFCFSLFYLKIYDSLLFLYHSLAAGSKIGQEIKSTFISGFHRLKDAPRPKMADIFKKKDRFDS